MTTPTNKRADEEIVAVCSLIWVAIIAAIGAFLNAEKGCKKRRKHWVKPWIRGRQLYGAYQRLFNDLQNVDEYWEQ